MFFQDIIQNLNNFWSKEGCLIMQPYDTEKGLGEGILLTCQYEHDNKDSNTFGPFPLDFFSN